MASPVILYNSSGTALAVQDGVAIPANTPGLMMMGSDRASSKSRYLSVTDQGNLRVSSQWQTGELYDNFPGAAVDTNNWSTSGSGASVTSSKLVITNPNTSNATTKVTSINTYRKGIFTFYGVKESARTNNSGFLLEVIDKTGGGSDSTKSVARIGFNANCQTGAALAVSDTTAKVRFNVAYNGTFNGNDIVVDLPYGADQVVTEQHTYQIAIGTSTIVFLIDDVVMAQSDWSYPGPTQDLSVQITGLTGGSNPASSVNMEVDLARARGDDPIDIKNNAANPIYVRDADLPITLYGKLTTTATTANQTVLTYTVPTGRRAYMCSFFVSDSNSGINGNPILLCKDTTTEPTNATETMGGVRHGWFHKAGSIIREDYAIPRPFAIGGDVIKIVVTPSGTTSTVWRAHMAIVVR